MTPGKTEMTTVRGVTARQDQLIMEDYAARLRKELKGKVVPGQGELEAGQVGHVFNDQ